jgi:SPP1 family predicted phage head-tail adaptor
VRSRKYSKRVGIWQTTAAADGYGGSTVTETLLSKSWARIRTINPERLIDFGITDTTHALRITLRNRKDLDYTQEGIYIKYNDDAYTIQSVMPDFEKVETAIVATRV